ncbi:DUF1214 domain-containing protein [Rhizobium sp. L1K21]|uniref:DUF1214 domain-containing protein n=1 Tax=Rhizobium sp. L1K21 TaxID=2954933 RepID=UPI002092C104|nr:DUF1214 domain-containing protein [Rhizobium sp. L1K21]MCO6186710.1 DUF1214 domain-containing protein [Rhizobium sp. L1K21]
MFRVPFLVLLTLAIAFGGGIYATQYAIRYSTGFGAISVGAWQAFPKAQTSDADPYARNHRAKAGQLLLGSAEGLAFSALTDSEGNRFDPACNYVVSGAIPTARFWVLTAADGDNKPLSAGAGLPSAYSSWTALYNKDGSLSFTVSSRAQPDNWLAVPADRRFKLILTLFDTPAAGNSGLIDLSMPTIEKAGCSDA